MWIQLGSLEAIKKKQYWKKKTAKNNAYPLHTTEENLFCKKVT